MKAQPKASHYINGSFVDDERGAAIPVIYPATGETIAIVHSATENIVELAVEAAREAQPAWARLKPVERGRILRRAADILRARNAELARLETLDTGKAIQETLVADPASAADALEYFGGAVAQLQWRLRRFRRLLRLHAPRGARRLRRHRRLELSDPGRRPGSPRRRSPWATRWCSSRRRTRRCRRWRSPKSTPRPACPTGSSTSCRVMAMSAQRSPAIRSSPRFRSPARCRPAARCSASPAR